VFHFSLLLNFNILALTLNIAVGNPLWLIYSILALCICLSLMLVLLYIDGKFVMKDGDE